ncbi:MAG TPA: hypothetical protein VFH88_14280, partial [Candidatus Krumholzibacteria bacterium]|nr:hypothetical protein [Candidatus Krumholzibacteria bacterium]
MSKRSLWILAAAGIALAFGHVRTGHAQSGVDLSGTWVLNKDLSDDPQAMMQKRRQSMRPPGEGGGPGGGGGHGHYGEGRGGGP